MWGKMQVRDIKKEVLFVDESMVWVSWKVLMLSVPRIGVVVRCQYWSLVVSCCGPSALA